MSRASIQVLYVDDDPDRRERTSTSLEHEDDRLVVDTVPNPTKALEILQDSLPDCLISTYELPGRNGLEFLQRVRDDWPKLPFILWLLPKIVQQRYLFRSW